MPEIMKKIYLLMLMPIILASCKAGTKAAKYDDYKNYKFVVPTGAPAIAMSVFSSYKNFETVTDPSKILPMMATEQVDVAVLPTNVGINAINEKHVPYKILCTITFGNFYIASTGNDEDGIMGEDDYIVSFQKGAVPDKIFHYVHGDGYDNALHYVSSAQEAAKCLKLGKNLADESKTVDYVVLAEPALTNVLKATPTASLYENLQESYKAKSGGLILPQASVFVRKSLKQETVMEPIYGGILASVNLMINQPETVKDFMEDVDNAETVFGVSPDIAEEVTKNGNRMGLGCKLASTLKDDINNFLSIFNVEGLKDEDIAQ